MMLLAHDHYNFRAFKTLSGLGSASVISKTAKAAVTYGVGTYPGLHHWDGGP
jgi:hypothetical protein